MEDYSCVRWVFKGIDLKPGFRNGSRLPSVFQLTAGRWIYILQVPRLSVWPTYLYTRSWHYYNNGAIFDFREQRRSIRKLSWRLEKFFWQITPECWATNFSSFVIRFEGLITRNTRCILNKSTFKVKNHSYLKLWSEANLNSIADSQICSIYTTVINLNFALVGRTKSNWRFASKIQITASHFVVDQHPL